MNDKTERAKRRLIRCEQCSTPDKPIYHSWKRAESVDFQPAAENDKDSER